VIRERQVFPTEKQVVVVSKELGTPIEAIEFARNLGPRFKIAAIPDGEFTLLTYAVVRDPVKGETPVRFFPENEARNAIIHPLTCFLVNQ